MPAAVTSRTLESHLVSAVPNGPFPCVFRDQVGEYPANLYRSDTEKVVLSKKKNQTKNNNPNQKSAYTFSPSGTRCSWPLAAPLLKEMALPAVRARFHPVSRRAVPAGRPAAPAASCFTTEYLFMERSGGCKRPLSRFLLPPTAKSISYGAFQAKRRRQRQRMTERLT